MLGFRLFASEGTLGSLDLYGYRAAAFDETSRAMGTVLAAHAAMAVAGAQVRANDLGTIAGLNEALLARDVIGQAKGMLMVARGIDADAAFDALVRRVATTQRQAPHPRRRGHPHGRAARIAGAANLR